MNQGSNQFRQLAADLNSRGVVELTASGRGAICVLAVWGAGVISQLEAFFRAANRKPLAQQPTMKPVYGRWNDEDIIVCIHDDEYVEVHCHGGDFAKLRIVKQLESVGFEYRSVPEPTSVGTSAEAAFVELAKASTRKTAAILTWQSEGALDQAINRIDQLLSDDQAGQAREQIQAVLIFASLGLHLTTPWKIAVAGAPNAGKSSLINQIVGYGRSIVMDMPGTTRDLVSVETAIHGWPVQLIDTAGLRDSDDRIEQAGVALARSTLQQADLIVEVIDVTDPAEPLEGDNVVRVYNKCDLAQPPKESLAVAALHGTGMDRLLATISRRLVPLEPKPGQAIPFLPDHIAALEQRLQAAS